MLEFYDRMPFEWWDWKNAMGDWLNRTWLILLMVIVGIYALQTKPGIADFERHLRDRLMAVAAEQRVSADDNFLVSILKFGCSTNPADCVSILRNQISVAERDVVVARLVKLETENAQELCVGAFANWSCWTVDQKTE